jgi:hypothetical protein
MQMIRAYSGDEEATRLWKKYDSLSWAKLSEIYLSHDSLVGKDREVMLQVYIARRRKQQQDEKAKKTAAKEKRKAKDSANLSSLTDIRGIIAATPSKFNQGVVFWAVIGAFVFGLISALTGVVAVLPALRSWIKW